MAKLSHKILVVAAFPLIFELTILSVLLALSARLETARREEAHAREMATHLNRLNALQIERATALLIRHADKQNRDALTRESNHYVDLMEAECKAAEAQPDLTQVEKNKLRKMRELTAHISDSYAAATKQNSDEDGIARGLLVAGLESDMRKLSSLAQTVSDERPDKVAASRDMFVQYEGELRAVIYVAAIISVLAAISMTYWLYTSTSVRLSLLLENTKRMAAGAAPKGGLQGSDEIAQVNSLYLHLHQSLIELREKERALLDSAQDVLCAIDSELRITEINEAVTRLIGADAEDVVGRRVIELVVPADQKKLLEALNEGSASEGPHLLELQLVTEAGETVASEWAVTISADGDYAYAVIHDISARKEIERIKRDFRSIVSHDLRNPLANMRLTLELVAVEGACGEVAAEAKEELQNVLGGLNRLLVLINNLLDMEKLDFLPESVRKVEVSCGAILDDALLSVGALVRQKKITIDCTVDRDMVVYCESEKIVQVLVNLLSKSIKQSPLGGRIRLFVGENKGQVKFEVEDSAECLPEDQLEKMFDRQSPGMDLAICKHVVSLHGGTIGARNVQPRGRTFWFKIPSGV